MNAEKVATPPGGYALGKNTQKIRRKRGEKNAVGKLARSKGEWVDSVREGGTTR
jgi:hypothetical protein